MAERVRPCYRVPPLSALPVLSWFLIFLIAPLLIVLIYSLAQKGLYGGVELPWKTGVLHLENFTRATDWLYLKVLWNSIELAFLTAISCLILGFPMAYVMATANPRFRNILLVLVVIPFWTNFVVRAYAIKLLLSDSGPINEMGIVLGLWSEPLALSNSPFAVWLGMVTNYLPFMVLPLYVALDRFDFSLLEASRDLGASFLKTLFKVIIPLNKTGMISGFIFVFTPALGEFVIPDLLGGAKTMLVGNLITEQFLKTRDWPFGSAISMLLIFTVLVSLVFYLKGSENSYSMSGSHSLRPRAPRAFYGLTGISYLLMYVPLLVLIWKSFYWKGEFTFNWYLKVFTNQEVLRSFKNSLWIGGWTTVGATLLGVCAAFALERTRFPGRKIFGAITNVPLIMPEIVLGLALLIWFVFLGIPLGRGSIILAHITFSVSYVIMTVRARLNGFDETLEEAAKDLGANSFKILTRVTLPLIFPAILSGALMAFTLSFDDFLITFFTSGVGVDTLPVKIYSMIKFGVSPEINALSTVLIVSTLILVSVFFRPQKSKIV